MAWLAAYRRLLLHIKATSVGMYRFSMRLWKQTSFLSCKVMIAISSTRLSSENNLAMFYKMCCVYEVKTQEEGIEKVVRGQLSGMSACTGAAWQVSIYIKKDP